MVEYVIIGFLCALILLMGAAIAFCYQLGILLLENIYLRISFIELDTKAIIFGLQKLNPIFSPDYHRGKTSDFSTDPKKDALKHDDTSKH